MKIGEKIKAARKAKGLSQQQLGGDDFTKGYISQLEKDYVNPSMKVLNIISERLEMPISYFLSEENDFSKQLQDRFISGENYFNQQNYTAAIEIFRSLISIINNEDTLFSLSMLNLGKSLFYKQEYHESIKILNSAINAITKINLYEELAEGYKYLGDCYFNISAYEAAIDQYKLGLSLIQNKNLFIRQREARFLLNLASSYSNMGNFKLAKEYFEKNIIHCQNNHILDTLLDSCVRLGYCYYELDNTELAFEYLNKASDINKGLASDIESTEIYSNLALVYAKVCKYEESFTLLEKSMDLSNKINYTFGYNLNVVYWVSVLIDMSKLDDALSFALRYLDRLKISDNKVPLYLLKGYLGEIYMKKNNFSESKKYFEEAIEGCISMSLYYDVHRLSKYLADMQVKIEPDEALEYYNLSIKYLSMLM